MTSDPKCPACGGSGLWMADKSRWSCEQCMTQYDAERVYIGSRAFPRQEG